MKQTKFLICIDNSEYPASLERRKIYESVPDPTASKTGHVRVIDESGEAYLYPSGIFIDAQLKESVEAAIINTA